MITGEFVLSPEEASKLPVHPYCEWFPPLSATDYECLGDSIHAQGLLDPIVLLDGSVLDGRNRLKACLEHEVTPRFIKFQDLTEIEPIDWVLAKNQYRRHLTQEQWCAVLTISEAERMRLDGEQLMRTAGKNGGRGKKKNPLDNLSKGFSTREQLAQKAGVSICKAKKALKIQKQKPELLNDVAAGRLSLKEAEWQSAGVPAKKERPPKPVWTVGRAIAQCRRYVDRALAPASPKQRISITDQLIEHLKGNRNAGN